MRSALLKLSLLGLLLGACSGSSDNIGSSRQALTGPIDVRMTYVLDGDETPPATGLRQIVVTIDRVDVRRDEDDGWTTVSTTKETIDLLSLQGTTFASLGIGRFPAGEIDAIRIFVSDA